MKHSRRRFLQTTATLATSGWVTSRRSTAAGGFPRSGSLTFGVITDVHQDVMHDGPERIRRFVAEMKDRKVDFVLNLGDFCVPHARNEPFLRAWNELAVPRYHVLGNHDMDGGHKREQAVEFLGMPSRYYSFDGHGVHFIVLDGNDPQPGVKAKGYPIFVADDQLKWFEADLAHATLPTIVCIHQPIDCYDKGLKNAAALRGVLSKANAAAGFPKVLAVFSGHQHLDYVKVCDGVPHVQFNSASYFWMNIKHPSYEPEILKAHPSIAFTCPYAEALWAVVSIDFKAGMMSIEGRASEWKGSDPWTAGVKEDAYQNSRELCRPAITSRQLKLPGW